MTSTDEMTDSALRNLLRAIAAGDRERALRMLEATPRLASEATRVGATRGSPSPHFLREIGRYVYAGDTALHIAAAAYRADIAEMLVANGADISARNRRGAEPLHYACAGHPGSSTWNPDAQAAVVEYLLRAGADANSADHSGVTPLHRAVRTRCAGVVRVLLAHGAEPKRKNGSGSTPFHLAVQTTGRGGSGDSSAKEQQAEIIRVLMAHGARLTDADAHGKSVSESIASTWVKDLLNDHPPG